MASFTIIGVLPALCKLSNTMISSGFSIGLLSFSFAILMPLLTLFFKSFHELLNPASDIYTFPLIVSTIVDVQCKKSCLRVSISTSPHGSRFSFTSSYPITSFNFLGYIISFLLISSSPQTNISALNLKATLFNSSP